MANRYFNQFLDSAHVKSVFLNCNFVIDLANGNGFGLRSLKGPRIKAVYGHTSATPAVGNPNPPAGYYIVQFEDPYVKYLSGFAGFACQTSGSSILVASAGVTSGLVYIITIVGTTTAAGWQSLGLPVGVTPAVGVTFVATASTTATGTGAVQVPNVNGSGIASIEVVGDPSTTMSPIGLGRANAYLLVRTMAATNSSTTTLIAAQPADNTVLGLNFWFSDSSVPL